jgi:hypothetical protein
MLGLSVAGLSTNKTALAHISLNSTRHVDGRFHDELMMIL